MFTNSICEAPQACCTKHYLAMALQRLKKKELYQFSYFIWINQIDFYEDCG